MSLIKLKRTKNSKIDKDTTYLESGETLVMDFTEDLPTEASPFYIAVSDVDEDNNTKLSNAHIIKGFESINKADSLVFVNGDNITNEGGKVIGSSVVNAEELTALESTPKNYYFVLVDDRGKAYRVKIDDVGLKFDATTGKINNLGW